VIEHAPVSLADAGAARARIADVAVRTPVVRLPTDPGAPRIFLKLESLQPVGSFKIRGAGNTMRQADPGALRSGVWTVSAGNMAQGVAWYAREMGLPCTVVVPDHAPATKLDGLPDLDAVVIPYGGDGLACGIASVLRTLRPGIRVYASEIETAAPPRRVARGGRAHAGRRGARGPGGSGHHRVRGLGREHRRLAAGCDRAGGVPDARAAGTGAT
jgi:threonine dehydratase